MNTYVEPALCPTGQQNASRRGYMEVSSMRKRTVIIEWADSEVEDADEVVVYADTLAQAVDKAKKKWRMAIGVEFPNCRLVRAFVLTPAKSVEFL